MAMRCSLVGAGHKSGMVSTGQVRGNQVDNLEQPRHSNWHDGRRKESLEFEALKGYATSLG